MISKDNTRVNVTIPKELDTHISNICNSLHISKSEFIFQSICYFLNDFMDETKRAAKRMIKDVENKEPID